MTEKKRKLFGGALRSAGLVAAVSMATPANAEFVPHDPASLSGPDNYTFAVASDINAQPLFLLYNKAQSPAFADPTNYSGLGGAITAYVMSTTFRASVAIGEGGLWSYAAGVIRHYFTVDRPTQVILEWDLRAAAPEFAWAYLTDAYLGGLALDDGSEYRNGFFVNTGAGEASLNLLPGVVPVRRPGQHMAALGNG